MTRGLTQLWQEDSEMARIQGRGEGVSEGIIEIVVSRSRACSEELGYLPSSYSATRATFFSQHTLVEIPPGTPFVFSWPTMMILRPIDIDLVRDRYTKEA